MTSEAADLLPRRSVRHLTRQCLLATLSFSLVIQTLRPERSSDHFLSAKQRYFSEHKDEFDILFIGSSRIYRAFDPLRFTEQLSPASDLKAFNFGVGGLRPHELDHLLRTLLESRPQRLRYVLIELMDWSPSLPIGLESHQRTVDWHTLSATWQACRTEGLSNNHWWTRILSCQQHLALAACRLINHGNGPRRWREWTDRETPDTITETQLDNGHGFVALDRETTNRFRERRQRFLSHYYGIFLEQILAIETTNRLHGNLSRFNIQAQRDQQSWLLQQGLKPIYVIPNVRWGTPSLNCLESQEILSDVVTMNHPKRFPALYQPNHYFDRGHLNQVGAKSFSQILADLVRPHLAQSASNAR
ncbi:MAG: hypothetical protein ABGZ17_05165 [Planctomycetaceae bacterium]